MARFLARMMRAAILDGTLYEEVEADRGATWQAVGVVGLSSLAAGLGSGASTGPGGVVLWTVASLLGWYLWAYLIYVIGTRLLPEPNTRADHGELLRTIGFASAPGLIRLLGLLPGLTGVVAVLAQVWMLVAMIVAVRHALDYTSLLRAIGVCVLGWGVVVVLLLVLVSPLAEACASDKTCQNCPLVQGVSEISRRSAPQEPHRLKALDGGVKKAAKQHRERSCISQDYENGWG
jgi:hypothetical protein